MEKEKKDLSLYQGKVKKKNNKQTKHKKEPLNNKNNYCKCLIDNLGACESLSSSTG